MHSECVTELEQAIYGIRGAMFFMRLGVDRLTWYFFANGKGGLYSRSGLLSSVKTGFQEKQSFHAFQKLIELLGDKYFLEAIQENDEAWVYKFGDANGSTTHLVAWRPIAGTDTTSASINLNIGYAADSVWQLSGNSLQDKLVQNLAAYDKTTHILTLQVSAIPVVAHLRKDN